MQAPDQDVLHADGHLPFDGVGDFGPISERPATIAPPSGRSRSPRLSTAAAFAAVNTRQVAGRRSDAPRARAASTTPSSSAASPGSGCRSVVARGGSGRPSSCVVAQRRDLRHPAPSAIRRQLPARDRDEPCGLRAPELAAKNLRRIRVILAEQRTQTPPTPRTGRSSPGAVGGKPRWPSAAGTSRPPPSRATSSGEASAAVSVVPM